MSLLAFSECRQTEVLSAINTGSSALKVLAIDKSQPNYLYLSWTGRGLDSEKCVIFSRFPYSRLRLFDVMDILSLYLFARAREYRSITMGRAKQKKKTSIGVLTMFFISLIYTNRYSSLLDF